MAHSDFSGPLVVTGETNPQGVVAHGSYSASQANSLILEGGDTTSHIIAGSVGLTFRNNADTADRVTISDAGQLGLGGLPGAAVSANTLVKSVTGIADAAATGVLTLTVPNAAQAALLNIKILASLGAGGAVGADEASAVYENQVAIARTAGVATVATAGTAVLTASSAVAGAATITLTVAVSAMTGAVGAQQTFTVNVTIAHGTGASTNHRAIVVAELVNAEASGVTMA